MKVILVIVFLTMSQIILASGKGELHLLKIEAKTSLSQVAFVYEAIERHKTIESSKMICFELGQLFTHLFHYNLAIDGARGELGRLDWETRMVISKPYALRSTTMGACGLIFDPNLPENDFYGLGKKLDEIKYYLQEVVRRLK